MRAILEPSQMNSNVDAAIFSTNDIDIADRLTEINMVRDTVIISLKIPIIAPMIHSINMIYPLLNDEPETPGRFTLST